MKIRLLILSFFISFAGLAQNYKLKPKYQDLSKLSLDSAARIVKTLSNAYGCNKFKSKDTLYFYSGNPQFNLHKDSLTLYYLMHVEKNNKETESTFEKNVEPKIATGEYKYSGVKEEMSVYETNLREQLKYVYRIHVPVSYNSFDLILDVLPEYIKFCSYYNSNRIKAYNCKYNDIPFQLAYHKTILPEEFESIKMEYSGWMPRKTHYKKPYKPIKPSTDSKLIWQKQTGLPYHEAIKLKLTKDPLHLSRVLFQMSKVKPYKLKDILYNLTDSLEENVSEERLFYVNCDTCKLQFYDFSVEDNDQIKIYYNDKVVINDTIRRQKQELSFISKKKDNILYMEAISEGSIGACTAQVSLEKNEFIVSLTKGKVYKIVVRKNNQDDELKAIERLKSLGYNVTK